MKHAHLVDIWADYADRLKAAEIEQFFGPHILGVLDTRYVKFSPWYIDLLYDADGSRWS
jgi:hypothetical protein